MKKVGLSKVVKIELNKFLSTDDLLSCDIYKDEEVLKILHNLKEKGFIRYRGQQENLQYFQMIR